MHSPLLTIIVPTYKRSANLALLLQTLREETVAVENEVVVYVSDNCSPDNTPDIVASASENWPALRSYRHSTNVGADRNFLHAVNQVQTRWFWIIGDDDLPKRGVIAQVIAVLRTREPALLFMQSEWIDLLISPDQGEPVVKLSMAELDPLLFAKVLNIWVTFISAMVVDRDRLWPALGMHSIDRFDQTLLVQLGWVLPMLNSGGPFVYVANRCVLATKDNTGGYGLLTVFGVNFTRIVTDCFGVGHPIAKVLINGNVSSYLPGLIWGGRNARSRSTHTIENPWSALNKQLGSHCLYWLLLVPLGRFPRWLAMPFFQSWRILSKLRSKWSQHFGIVVRRAV